MDDDALVATDCAEKFLDLFASMVESGLPAPMVTKAFMGASMAAFRQYIGDDDLSRIPALLRRYANTIERNVR